METFAAVLLKLKLNNSGRRSIRLNKITKLTLRWLVGEETVFIVQILYCCKQSIQLRLLPTTNTPVKPPTTFGQPSIFNLKFFG
jgi:hypothetical protein